jgi:hypothetical protein
MIQFHRYGSRSSLLNEPNTEVVNIPISEPFHITVDKSRIDCEWKMYIRQCGKVNPDCTVEDVLTRYSCIKKMDNDDTFYLSLIIPNYESVKSFRIASMLDDADMEIFEFGGGTKDELIQEVESYRYGVEVKPYGLKIYFPKDYKGDYAILTTSGDVTLLSDKFCYNKTDKYGIDICFKELGCYNVLFKNSKDEILAISNPIKIVNYKDKNLQVIEYYADGFWHRELIDIFFESEQLETSETERTLTDGSVAIYDTVIQPQSSIQTGVFSMGEHLWLLSLLKKGVRLNGRRAKLRGGYELIPSIRNLYYATGTIYYPDEVISTIKSCNSDCLSGSQLTYDIFC